jgi:indolepyruvate decarboxylase
MIDADGVQVRFHRYDGLRMTQVVAALLERLPQSTRLVPRFDLGAENPVVTPPLSPVAAADAGSAEKKVIRIAEVIAALRTLDQSRYSFVTDVGDSWFIGLELRADVFVAAGYYSSMGFGVPAALGAGIADPIRRPLAIVGDGAFQMTGTELATLVDHGLRPIVLLLNNGGYGMLEAVDRPRQYYERRNWDYPSLARALGAEAERVSSAGELRAALRRAEASPVAYLIEALTAKDDLSPVMARIRSHIASAWRVPAAL